MVKDTQTICLSVFDHFVGLALKGLKAGTQFLGEYFQEVSVPESTKMFQ